MDEAEKIIKILELKPHPEGGYFSEVYRCEELIERSNLPPRYSQNHSHSTSIYFLLNKNDKSHFHKLLSDEIWHFYSGSTIVLYCIDVDGNFSKLRLGINFEKTELPQIVIKRNTWFAAEVEDKNSYSLIGCTVSPGFEFTDFELGAQEKLLQQFPQHAELIKLFTIG